MKQRLKDKIFGKPKKAKELRIKLDYQDFYMLVHWKEVEKEGTRLILADIGYKAMKGIVDDAYIGYCKRVHHD